MLYLLYMRSRILSRSRSQSRKTDRHRNTISCNSDRKSPESLSPRFNNPRRIKKIFQYKKSGWIINPTQQSGSGKTLPKARSQKYNLNLIPDTESDPGYWIWSRILNLAAGKLKPLTAFVFRCLKGYTPLINRLNCFRKLFHFRGDVREIQDSRCFYTARSKNKSARQLCRC